MLTRTECKNIVRRHINENHQRVFEETGEPLSMSVFDEEIDKVLTHLPEGDGQLEKVWFE